MTTLVVQIPCFNEEKTVGQVIKSIPKRIKGIKKVLIVVVNDGSTDNSANVAKKAGADVVITNKSNLGLARTFSKALKISLELGADIIVNTDADNQYDQSEIIKIVKPILEDKADMVIGDRQVGKLKHMPISKKIGNRLGTKIISILSGTDVKDASSGFRSFTKETALSFNIFSAHTYTHETIIQAAHKNLVIANVPISFKKRKYGNSRLIRGLYIHVGSAMATIIRTVLVYKSFKYFIVFGSTIILLGIILGVRYIYFTLQSEGAGHIQSLILASSLVNVGFITLLLGIIADILRINRRLLENMKHD